MTAEGSELKRPERWLVPTVGEGPSRVATGLRAAGHEVEEVTVGRIVPLPVTLPPCDWILVTSRHAAESLRGLSPWVRVAAIGETTAAAIREQGVAVSFVPSSPDSATFRREFAPLLQASDRVVRLKARQAGDSLAELSGCCSYQTLDVYENLAVPIGGTIDLSDYDGVYFSCASSVERLFAASVGRARCQVIGPATRAALEAHKDRVCDIIYTI